MSIRSGNVKAQAVIDSLKKEYPGSIIETLSYDYDSYDLILEHGDAVYIIGIKLTRANVNTVVKLLLYGKTVGQRYLGKKVAIKLYAPAIAPDAKAALFKAGGVFQKLGGTKARQTGAEQVKLTSPASWKVICHFFKTDSDTINHAAVSAGVSYPWARSVVKRLIELKAFEEYGKKVRLSDLDALFKHIAWERPINSLKGLDFKSAYADETEALKELYDNVEGIVPQSACALFTSADLYLEGRPTGGCVQLYADENAALVTKSLLGEGEGISFQVYTPDREMNVYAIDGIRVVSVEQTILDLAGLGMSGVDAAKVMVNYYRKLSVHEGLMAMKS